MEISYQREMKHNYLIIQPDSWQEEGYELRMLMGNSIEGLLKFRWKQIDKVTSFYYEITSKQPLSRMLAAKPITAEEIRQMVFCIAQTLNRMETYLLKEDQILLEADYIYVDPESYTIYLCMVPGRTCDFPESFGLLLQFILGKVNHQDKECVVLAYGLFQESQKENYGMEDLLKLIKTDEEGHEKEKTEEESDTCFQKASRVNTGSEVVKKMEDTWVEAYANGFTGETQKEKTEKGKAEKGRSEKEKNGKEKSGKEKGEKKRDEKKNDTEEKCKTEKELISTEIGHKKKSRIKQKLIGAAILILGMPILLWLFQGDAGIRKYGKGALLLDVVILAAAVLSEVYRKLQKNTEGKYIRSESDEDSTNHGREEYNPWKMVFDEEQVPKETLQPIGICVGGDTVLLTDLDQKTEIHKLSALEKGVEDIDVPYYPFIVGKQESMVDYVLKKDTISRLHLRIDREGQTYFLTDLNSTNGTSVRGHLLDANETVDLKSGDEVRIAEVGFLFL